MAAGSYGFEDWEDDHIFLCRYVYSQESSYLPPDYLREIEEYFQEHAPNNAAFRFERASAMLRFLVANVHSFTVGGLAMITSEAVEIRPALWVALYMFFAAPTDDKFDPNPDPKEILDMAEDLNENGLADISDSV